jgi:hypothetical protein
MSETRTMLVEVREGLAPATVPGDVVAALEGAAPGDGDALERGLTTAALVLVRLGQEHGEAMLRHLLGHDPGLVLNADPLFVDTLADEPELIVGPLAGTSPCAPVE